MHGGTRPRRDSICGCAAPPLASPRLASSRPSPPSLPPLFQAVEVGGSSRAHSESPLGRVRGGSKSLRTWLGTCGEVDSGDIYGRARCLHHGILRRAPAVAAPPPVHAQRRARRLRLLCTRKEAMWLTYALGRGWCGGVFVAGARWNSWSMGTRVRLLCPDELSPLHLGKVRLELNGKRPGVRPKLNCTNEWRTRPARACAIAQ